MGKTPLCEGILSPRIDECSAVVDAPPRLWRNGSAKTDNRYILTGAIGKPYVASARYDCVMRYR
ncbi:MAG: hypothetical protein ACI9DC_005119 [Gammaproteobacteria bacterium]|jgi:hypothetical protein